MNIRNSNKRFYKDKITDLSDQKVSVYGQLIVNDAGDKFSIKVDPETSLFSSCSCIVNERNYITGNHVPNYYLGSAVSKTYPARLANTQVQIKTIFELLSSTDKGISYSKIELQSEDKITQESYKKFNVYKFEVGGNKSIDTDTCLVTGNEIYKVISESSIDTEGFISFLAYKVPYEMTSGTLYSKAEYDPTDNSIESEGIPLTEVFLEDAFLADTKTSVRSVSVDPGDVLAYFISTTAPKAGDKLNSYDILEVTDNTTYYTCHCRP